MQQAEKRITPYDSQIFALSERLKQRPWKIAIDGPADAGKGSLNNSLAKHLNLRVIDTGKMYRAATWLLLHEGINPDIASDEDIQAHLNGINMELPGDGQSVILSGSALPHQYHLGQDDLYETAIGIVGSRLSAHAPVRDLLEAQQIEQVQRGSCVIEGRNMWEIVAQQADIMVYLYANDEVLAEREVERQKSRGIDITHDEAKAAIVLRNHQDMDKPRGRLLSPEEAVNSSLYHVVIDTSDLSKEEVLLAVLQEMDHMASV